MTNINPLLDIGDELLSVENPVRYLGGEFGQIIKKDANFTFVIAFPDLYEIGMSNQAVKIIYAGLNALPTVRCERVFTPQEDFENLLKSKQIPLYTLESGIPLNKTDIIGFSIGYELGITGALTILDCANVPLTVHERKQTDPIVIAGGCGVTNPAPFTDFFDAVFIGEAENELFMLIEQCATLKKNGGTRTHILEHLKTHPSIWVPGKKAVAAKQADFGQVESIPSWAPVSNVKVVQGHGVVEIMRGCPNGCRFCHAGIYYRPQRVKNIEHIIAETDRLVYEGGFREISLNSLSSGDYTNIENLLDTLNERYAQKNVSFQLPSLKVNTFTLPILEKLSQVRKSGLTFAFETPVDAWQLSLNKEVCTEHIIDIIKEAKKRGWSKAKFYFMIGLPVETGGLKEEEQIVSVLKKIQYATRIQCTVNVGTFIPKPHTPYERVRQISPEEAQEKLYYIRSHLQKGIFKVSTHNEFTSFLEGMICRSDKKIGSIILAAYKAGCRLDAWESKLKKDLWNTAIEQADFNVKEETLRERSADEILPWNEVSLGLKDDFLKTEYQKSQKQELTSPCIEKCIRCGVCNNSQHVYKNINKVLNSRQVNTNSNYENKKNIHFNTDSRQTHNIEVMYRVIFSFSKEKEAAFIPHLGLTETLIQALYRSGLPIIFSAGFNPIPRLEFAQTLSIGIESQDEIASCLLYENYTNTDFIALLNNNLPAQIRLRKAAVFPVSNKRKRESLATSFWGAEYTYRFTNTPNSKITDFLNINKDLLNRYDLQDDLNIQIPFKNDRKFRDALSEFFNQPLYTFVHIIKTKTLAHKDANIIDYFDLYKEIALINARLI